MSVKTTHVINGAGGAGSGAAGGTAYIPEAKTDITQRNQVIAYMAVNAWINRDRVVLPRGSRFGAIYFADMNLCNAVFEGVSFLNCSFSRSDLRQARFVDCNLRDCFFYHARLDDARFDRCDLSGARFYWASLRATAFHACDMNPRVFEAHRADQATFHMSTLKGRVLATRPLIAEFNRGDYVFRAIRFAEGPAMIEAGCRWMTWRQYWAHTRTYDDADKKARTRAILKLFKVCIMSPRPFRRTF